MNRRKRWLDLTLRSATKRYTCALQPIVGQCDGVIAFGQTYYDGGCGQRAHARCARIAADEAQSDALSFMSSALAAGLFGARADRTTRGRN
jgi:hypothetical protein